MWLVETLGDRHTYDHTVQLTVCSVDVRLLSKDGSQYPTQVLEYSYAALVTHSLARTKGCSDREFVWFLIPKQDREVFLVT